MVLDELGKSFEFTLKASVTLFRSPKKKEQLRFESSAIKMTKIKKVSVVSIESLKIRSTKLTKHWENVHLKDRFFYVHILFLLLGLMHFLPFTFFVTANAYWMQKFRNVSDDDLEDASKRTSLQSHFASGTSITNSIANSTFVIVAAVFGNRFKARSRVIFTLGVMTGSFALTALFVEVNTDSWQLTFFCITFGILALINAVNATLQLAVFADLVKFPPYYMKVYLFGEGCAAIFNSSLQIITLAIGTSVIASALIYFILGATVMGVTLVLFYFTKYNKYYRYFVEHGDDGDGNRDMLSFSEFKDVLLVIWPSVLLYVIYDLGRIPQTPVAALVVSEDYGKGYAWNDVYFVPIITFLLVDVSSLFGRQLCSMTKPVGPFPAIVFAFLRMVICVPLILLCNAQPRNHLPVLLKHDWEYVLVQLSISMSTGYLVNLVFLSINRLLEPEKVEDGYLVLMISICSIAAVFSPLAEFFVDLL